MKRFIYVVISVVIICLLFPVAVMSWGPYSDQNSNPSSNPDDLPNWSSSDSKLASRIIQSYSGTYPRYGSSYSEPYSTQSNPLSNPYRDSGGGAFHQGYYQNKPNTEPTNNSLEPNNNDPDSRKPATLSGENILRRY